MLALRIRYLSGASYAATFHDRRQPEWPPHPSRVFSALTAACYEASLEEPGLTALRWLERQGPPHIAASQAHVRQQGTVFVPVNDPENVNRKHRDRAKLDAALARLPVYRDRQPRYFPCALPESPEVWMIWPDALPSPETRKTLDTLTANVVYLGNSRSLVAASLDDAPPAPTLMPTTDGEHLLRVVAPGRVDELIERFELGLRPTPGLFQRYAGPEPPRISKHPRSCFNELIVLCQTSGPPLSLSNSLLLVERVRRAALAVAGDDAPAVLHGHGEPNHAAWVPLPYVGARHADGHLLGVGLALPATLATQDRQQVLRVLARLEKVTLGDGRNVHFAPSEAGEPRRSLWSTTWTKPTTVWTTVTPLTLHRFPKARYPSEAIIAEACTHLGLPPPLEVAVHRYGRLTGTPLSNRFQVHRKGHLPRLWTHATLRFDEPIQGPVILGAGRYFGLGLCRPLLEDIGHDA